MLFNVLSPLAVGIDANTFSDAAKRFVEMQRNLDITRIILADRFNNAMRADVAYTIRDGNVVAGISLMPTIYPRTPYPAVVTTNPNMPYPVGAGLVGTVSPFQPAGLIKTTSDGQQVLPINNNNVAVGGVNMGLGVGMGFSPTLAHGATFMPYNNKNSKK
tara:strand:+ start:11741 stop:12220 length:480 start_codon:yes stop_codon:yes gene_type:complete